MSDGGSGTSWQAVQREVLRRIHAKEWKPGERIPHEAELAREFGCARATVNRALREVADTGLLERRRRAGTRVALRPVRKATLDIPVIRSEVEAQGMSYAYSLISRGRAVPPPRIRGRMGSASGRRLLHITGLHLANGRPHAFEDRWIDPDAVPEALAVDFGTISPNEWLVLNVPFVGGDIAFSATPAGKTESEALGCGAGAPLFLVERMTWREDGVLTSVRLFFAPGHRLHTEI